MTDLVFPQSPTDGQVYQTWKWVAASNAWKRLAPAAAGVTSFNTRTGAVILSTADVSAAGGPYETQAAAALLAPLASPTFTGTVTIPAGALIAGYAPLASPALTGTPTAPTQATPTDATNQLATDAFVQSAIGASVAVGNRLRNGTFDVWQRGTSIVLVAGQAPYTADGWQATTQGAGATIAQGGTAAWSGGASPPRSLLGLWLKGVAGVTQSLVQQRIESNISAPLGGVSITFQAKVYNQTGAPVTPQFQCLHATGAGGRDDWSNSAADLTAVNMQSCASGQWTTVAYTFTVPVASAQSGLMVQLIFGAAPNASGKDIILADADLRATPGLPVGLCANPPPPELRPIHTELLFCQRYFWDSQGAGGSSAALQIGGYYGAAGTFNAPQITFPVTMRANPTVVLRNQAYGNATTMASGVASARTLNTNLTVSAAGNAFCNFNLTASAEL